VSTHKKYDRPTITIHETQIIVKHHQNVGGYEVRQAHLLRILRYLWCTVPTLSKGAFPPSHFSNKLDDKLAHQVASQTNVTHLCLVCQSEVCCKPNWFATNSLRQLCERVCHQVCCKNVMVETHLKRYEILYISCPPVKLQHTENSANLVNRSWFYVLRRSLPVLHRRRCSGISGV
jgi:hypothetical protein